MLAKPLSLFVVAAIAEIGEISELDMVPFVVRRVDAPARSERSAAVKVLIRSVQIVWTLFLGFVFTALSLYRNGTHYTRTGDSSFADLPTGGFPLPYLYDSPSTSVIGSLGAEDEFRLAPFLFNFAFFSLSVVAISTLAIFCWKNVRAKMNLTQTTNTI